MDGGRNTPNRADSPAGRRTTPVRAAEDRRFAAGGATTGLLPERAEGTRRTPGRRARRSRGQVEITVWSSPRGPERRWSRTTFAGVGAASKRGRPCPHHSHGCGSPRRWMPGACSRRSARSGCTLAAEGKGHLIPSGNHAAQRPLPAAGAPEPPNWSLCSSREAGRRRMQNRSSGVLFGRSAGLGASHRHRFPRARSGGHSLQQVIRLPGGNFQAMPRFIADYLTGFLRCRPRPRRAVPGMRPRARPAGNPPSPGWRGAPRQAAEGRAAGRAPDPEERAHLTTAGWLARAERVSGTINDERFRARAAAQVVRAAARSRVTPPRGAAL